MELSNEQIVDGALSLPPEERAHLIDRLIESLDPSRESEHHDAWVAEIRRRIDDVRSGRVKPIPGDEAFDRVLRAIER